jgi:hypothetical protein
MSVIIIRHKVKDFAAWKIAFDAHKPVRDAAGLSKSRVLRSAGDANEVVLVFDDADIDKTKAFMASADVQAAIKAAGVTDKPDVYFLDAVE